ncbi:MAG: 2-isopropylmalate synthase [Armatimonadetes bacterium]|nr:2-isopropylmalate synthase [Armatimonadota bacterium]
MGVRPQDLIYDWNREDASLYAGRVVELEDETLRDGLQSPSVIDPEIDDKLRIIHLMEALGIHGADVGLPGAGQRNREHVVRMCREIRDNHMRLEPSCAARTLIVDIQPIVEVSQELGMNVEANVFLGSSPIRLYAEDWPMEKLLKHTVEAVSFATKNGISCMYVTEDTTRAHPDTLRALYTAAIEAGARRVCLADTVGHATPEGVRNLVKFIRGVIAETGQDVKIDWHGHRDRALAIVNALAAIEAGADRIHGTAIGVGERVGNTPMDLLLINLKVMGMIDSDLSRLKEYTETVARATGVPVPHNWPVLGARAYRPAGDAVAHFDEAERKWLSDCLYGALPVTALGLR